MANKKKLQKISAELKKASQMHAAQAKKIDNMSKGPSMINLAAAIGTKLGGKQKNPNKDTSVGNVPPHSHDNSKNNNTMQPIGNITGNLNNNLKVQQLGADLFQGEALAEQEMAKRNLGKPVMPPSPDPMGDQYGNMFNPPFSKKVEGKIHQQRPNRHNELKRKEKFNIGVNMEGPLAQTKYKEPLEGVQNLQDMGAVKEDKKGQYVVNENATSVSDTLRFPKGTKHYSGKPYKKGQLIDESDYEDIIKKVNKS